jgi:hypothetical protein
MSQTRFSATMIHGRLLRLAVLTAAVLSLMVVMSAPALANSDQRCSQRGGHGDNTVTCNFYGDGTQDGSGGGKLINVVINNGDILSDNQVNVLTGDIDAYILNNVLNCNSILTVASSTCGTGITNVIIAAHNLIGVKLYSVVITINGITKKYYDCGCK